MRDFPIIQQLIDIWFFNNQWQICHADAYSGQKQVQQHLNIIQKLERYETTSPCA
jgi:hypothetical protein